MVVAVLEVITTFAVSIRPASSVTVSDTVATPHEGAVIVALELVALLIVGMAPATLLH